MTVKNEGNTLGDLIASEWDENYSRDVVVIEATVTLGSPIKTGTATFTAAAAADGASVKGLALEDGVAGQSIAVLCRGPVIVKDSGISYPAGATTNQKAAFRTGLLGIGIKSETALVG